MRRWRLRNVILSQNFCSFVVVPIQGQIVHCGKFIMTPKMGERKSALPSKHATLPLPQRDNPSFGNYSNLPQIGIWTISDGKIGQEGWHWANFLTSCHTYDLVSCFKARIWHLKSSRQHILRCFDSYMLELRSKCSSQSGRFMQKYASLPVNLDNLVTERGRLQK